MPFFLEKIISSRIFLFGHKNVKLLCFPITLNLCQWNRRVTAFLDGRSKLQIMLYVSNYPTLAGPISCFHLPSGEKIDFFH